MKDFEANNNEDKKLVKTYPVVSLGDTPLVKPSTNKPVHRIAEPHIRPHKVKGKNYYFYCQGQKEIYLGDADAILAAIMKAKQNSIR